MAAKPGKNGLVLFGSASDVDIDLIKYFMINKLLISISTSRTLPACDYPVPAGIDLNQNQNQNQNQITRDYPVPARIDPSCGKIVLLSID